MQLLSFLNSQYSIIFIFVNYNLMININFFTFRAIFSQSFHLVLPEYIEKSAHRHSLYQKLFLNVYTDKSIVPPLEVREIS